MSDLSELDRAGAVKIAGSNPATGLEDNFMEVDSSGLISVKLFDGSGTAITSQANGAQRALDVGIDVAGVQIDPRSIRALTASDVVSAVQSGTWNIGTLTSITNPVAVTQSTSPWITKDQSDGPVTPGTVASFSQLIGGQFNTALPTLTNTQQSAFQLDSSGRLIIRPLTSADVVTANQGGSWTVAATQSGTWTTGRTWTLGSGTDSVAAVQSGTWTVQQGTPPWTVVGSVASAATDSGNPLKIGGVFNTTQPTVTNGQRVDAQSTARGALIVATGVDAFNINNITGTVSLPTGAATAANQATEITSLSTIATNTSNTNTSVQNTQGPVTPGTVATKSDLIGVQFNTVLPTLTTGQQSAVQADSSGRILVGSIASALPAGANTIGAVTQASGPWTQNLTQVGGSSITLGQKIMSASLPVIIASDQTALPVSQSGTWTTGRTWTLGSGTDSVAAVQSGAWSVSVSNFPADADALAQASTTSGQLGALIMGATTTSAPTYTTATTNPLSLTTTGLLRVDGSGVTQPVSGTVTANQGGSWTVAATQSGAWTTGRTWTLSSGTDSIAATQSGTWTVQPGNTANTTPWLVTDSSDGPVAPGTAAGKSSLGGLIFNTALPTLTNTQQSALQGDSSGRLIISPLTNTSVVKAQLQDNAGNALNSTSNALNMFLTNASVAVTQSTSPWVVSGTVTANQGTANATPWNENVAQFGGNNVVTGTGVSGAGIPRVTVSSDSNILVTQSTSPWVTKDQADGPVTPGTVASFSELVGGQFNTALPTLTNTQQSAMQLDSSGRLIIRPLTSSDVVSAVQSGTWNIGTLTSITNPVAVTQSTSPWVISAASLPLPTGAATEATLAKLPLAQASTTSGQSGPLMQGAVTTAAPTYTTGQTDPLSLTTTGLLRVDGSGVTQPVSGTVTANQGTANTLANAWAQKITDGTNGPVAVKAASTSPVAIDPALVVTISPNTGTLPENLTQVGGASITLGQKTGALSIPVVLPSDQAISVNVLQTLGLFSFGQVTHSATTQVPVEATTYTEPTSNSAMTLVSSSASDASAGTGARTVTVTYLDSTGAGPNTTVFTLNGITPVTAGVSNMCFIEKIIVTTVGSGASNVGTLTLKTGGAATVGTVAVGINETQWAHHYTPSGKTSYISGLALGNNASSSGAGDTAVLKVGTPTVANTPEIQISDFVNVAGGVSTIERIYNSPIKIIGPARIRAYTSPLATSNYTTYVSFDYVDN